MIATQIKELNLDGEFTTRSGLPARFLGKLNSKFEYVFAIALRKGEEIVKVTKSGCIDTLTHTSDWNIVNVQKKVVRYASIYPDGNGNYNIGQLHNSASEAARAADSREVFARVKIEFVEGEGL